MNSNFFFSFGPWNVRSESVKTDYLGPPEEANPLRNSAKRLSERAVGKTQSAENGPKCDAHQFSYIYPIELHFLYSELY